VLPLAPASEPDPFSTRWEPSGRAPVLVVRGRLDSLTAARLSAAICAYGRERVVVDVEGVPSIEPAALSDVLLAARVVGIEVHLVGAEVLVAAGAQSGGASSWRPRTAAASSLPNRIDGPPISSQARAMPMKKQTVTTTQSASRGSSRSRSSSWSAKRS
jgi:anti-anti-sigma regulatory factor